MQPKKFAFALVAFFAVASAPPAATAPLERRLALVIGNSSYKSGPLATPANDAGLIAQSLQAAGFDVVGARDLDESSLREAFRDFLAKTSEAGPDTLAAVYFAGYGLQLDGENYLLPTNASIVRAQDITVQAFRVSDFMRDLAALHLKATIVILDAARANPYSVVHDQPLASGLAWARPDSGMLIAFNAMPGTVAGRDQQGYGPYAKALAEMLSRRRLLACHHIRTRALACQRIDKAARRSHGTHQISKPKSPSSKPILTRRHGRIRRIRSVRGRWATSALRMPIWSPCCAIHLTATEIILQLIHAIQWRSASARFWR